MSLILIASGLYFKKKALLLVILGGVLLLLTGLTTFADPISHQTINKTYVYDNTTLTNTIETINPVPINNRTNTILSWTMLILGLACIIGSSIKLYDSRFDEEDPEQIQIFDN